MLWRWLSDHEATQTLPLYSPHAPNAGDAILDGAPDCDVDETLTHEQEMLAVTVSFLQQSHELSLDFSPRDGINLLRYALKRLSQDPSHPLGKDAAFPPGSKVHDEISYDASKKASLTLVFIRKTNNAGGLEGGMTNGKPVVVRGAMKPISTLGKPLKSVDLNTKETAEAGWERSDISAISAASVVMENVIAFEIARAFLEKFGGDSLTEVRMNYDNFLATARRLPL